MKIIKTALLTILIVTPVALSAREILPPPTEREDLAPLSGLQGMTESVGKAAGFNPATSETTLAEISGNIVAAFLSLIGIIFITYLIYGGYLWMTAAGNDENITKAKSIIRNGIIGLIVTFSAATIYFFVTTIFGGTSP